MQTTFQNLPDILLAHKLPWKMSTLSRASTTQDPIYSIGSLLHQKNNFILTLQVAESMRAVSHQTLVHHDFPPVALAWSARSPVLAAAGCAVTLYTWCDAALCKKGTYTNRRAGTKAPPAPLTAVEFVPEYDARFATASVDTTCTVWNADARAIETQLIAHDTQVNDLSFAPSPFVFATAGADGSVRVFDLRDLARSTIVFDGNGARDAVLRVEWNKRDMHTVACLTCDGNCVHVVDVRGTASRVVNTLRGDCAYVNTIAWQGRDGVVVGDERGHVRIWNVDNRWGVKEFLMNEGVVKVECGGGAVGGVVAVGTSENVRILRDLA